MEILLIRHGEAVDEGADAGDAGRWLTAKGRKRTRRVGAWLAKHKARRPKHIWTSPLVRAVQTAEILAASVDSSDVVVCAALVPGRDPRDVLDLLARCDTDGPIALVGHEPSLSRIAASLLGMPDHPPLEKSAVVAISWRGKGAVKLRFSLEPKRLEVAKTIATRKPT